jgi:ankyrin repeat protein
MSSTLAKADINIETREGYTPLFAACKKNDISTVQYLLDNGADIDSKSASGLAPLNIALEKKHIELAEDMIKSITSMRPQELARYNGVTPVSSSSDRLALYFSNISTTSVRLFWHAICNGV